MVKNTTGGSGNKKFGRKHAGAGPSRAIRTAHDTNEIYAIATKMLGNNMFNCHGIDDQPRLCHIRGKFSGRGKRHNLVTVGTWILVGDREWDARNPGKITQCDLMEVYSNDNKKQLIHQETQNWGILHANDSTQDMTAKSEGGSESMIQFITERDEELAILMKDTKKIGEELSTTEITNFTETELESVCVDDI